MIDWIRDNAGTVLGWIGGLAVVAFVFGRRFSDLESADKSLAANVAELATKVGLLSDAVNGQNGNAMLARSVDALTAGLTSIGSRLADHDGKFGKIDVKLSEFDSMRQAFEFRAGDFVHSKWEPLVEVIKGLQASLHEQNLVLARIESRCSFPEHEPPKRRNGGS